MTVKLEKIDDKFVLVLTDDLVESLGWNHGDIFAASAKNTTLEVVRTETAHDRTMKIARKVMEEYRETLATLAKS